MTSPSTGQLIDLNPLAQQTWVVPGLYGDSFEIRACGPLNDVCDGHSLNGVCQQTPTPKSFGLANSTVVVDDDVVTVTYIGGSACVSQPQLTRSTIITFYCACVNPGTQGPTIATDPMNGCTAYFNWPTNLVCSPDQLVKNCPSTTSQATFKTTTIPLYTTPGPTNSPSSRGSSSAAIGGAIGGLVGAFVLGALGYLVYRRTKKSVALSIKAEGTVNVDSTDKVALMNNEEDEEKL